MIIQSMNESTLSQSQIFSDLNTILGDNNIISKAKNIITNGKILTLEDLEHVYITLKQMSDTLTKKGLNAFDNQDVVFVYMEDTTQIMSLTIPFLTFKRGDKHITYVFANKYVTLTRDKRMNIKSNIFRDFLIAGAIANSLKKNYISLSGNQYLSKIMTEIYSSFFLTILNREYSISTDKNLSDTIKYWSGKFFLKNVFSSTDSDSNIDNIALSNTKYIDEMTINDIKARYNSSSINGVKDLLKMMSEESPRLKSLEMGKFISAWMNYFYLPSLLGIDNIEYFIMMINMLLSGNGIINIGASELVKNAKNIKTLQSELLKIIN